MHFNDMPTTLNEKWTIVHNHRDDMMKMTNGDMCVELWKHFSDDTYYQSLGARIIKTMGSDDWHANFGESMVKKRKEEVVKELEEKKEEYEKSRKRRSNLAHQRRVVSSSASVCVRMMMMLTFC